MSNSITNPTPELLVPMTPASPPPSSPAWYSSSIVPVAPAKSFGAVLYLSVSLVSRQAVYQEVKSASPSEHQSSSPSPSGLHCPFGPRFSPALLGSFQSLLSCTCYLALTLLPPRRTAARSWRTALRVGITAWFVLFRTFQCPRPHPPSSTHSCAPLTHRSPPSLLQL